MSQFNRSAEHCVACGKLRRLRPDLDNLAKTILDGCNGIVYADDAQIIELTVSKWRVEKPEDVGMHVEISTE